MEDSELHTLEQLDESEVLQASRDPFKDNNTVCKCRGMYVRERGRNACPCKNIGQFCSSTCHKSSFSSACLNKQRVADGDKSSSEDTTDTVSTHL